MGRKCHSLAVCGRPAPPRPRPRRAWPRSQPSALPPMLRASEPGLHFHVLMTAPGKLRRNQQIGLGVESVNTALRPALQSSARGLPPCGCFPPPPQTPSARFPRVCGAPIRSLTAHHAGDDPNSAFYSTCPLPSALITEAIPALTTADHGRRRGGSRNHLQRLRSEGLHRSKRIDGLIVGPFAATIDFIRKLHLPDCAHGYRRHRKPVLSFTAIIRPRRRLGADGRRLQDGPGSTAATSQHPAFMDAAAAFRACPSRSSARMGTGQLQEPLWRRMGLTTTSG